MKDFLLLVSPQRRPDDVGKTKANGTFTATPPHAQAPADRVETSVGPALRILHLLALLTLPLSLYLVYTHGEYYAYRGLLAIAVIANLLFLARIDAAHARQTQQELQSLHADNQTNHG